MDRVSSSILHSKTLHQTYGSDSPRARTGGGEIWVTSVHPGLVETNIATSAEQSGLGMIKVVPVLRMFGFLWAMDKGSWNSLFCVASQNMKADQNGTYLEIFRRFGEPWWQSEAAKDGNLAVRLWEWTRKTLEKEGWV